METKVSLNEAIINIRVELQKSNLKKSGKNKFAGFDYFELADFLPRLNELMAKYKVNDLFVIDGETASLTLIKGEESQKYVIPFVMFEVPVNSKGVKSMQDIQYLGALNTYYKRYLYLNAFGITDGDVIDAMDNTDTKAKTNAPKEDKKATSVQVSNLRNMINGEQETKLLEKYQISKLEDLTLVQASSIISQLKARNEANNGTN